MGFGDGELQQPRGDHGGRRSGVDVPDGTVVVTARPLRLLGVDKRTMRSYRDASEEGRGVFLEELASSSFLQENGEAITATYLRWDKRMS
ncbi:hypothetical protein EYF80_022657 [Liparis tanakae]|uniref:Uncharacterized protein n=1 Tax=Liparis tanakae TaxID=230148 RepID=A0A4Z2HN01_9TELE|nr:hypothetical protein EYF80_022657 [Liparis tanakae]